jgi:cytidine deaminase
MAGNDKPLDISERKLEELASAAWAARENAHTFGPTKVGCAVLTDDGRIFVGCNVEHRFRCHDVHAEVNAITSFVSSGSKSLVAIVIAAKRDRFTPCGGCMDWILQFGSEQTIVAFQASPGGNIQKYTAGQLMPFYPA